MTAAAATAGQEFVVLTGFLGSGKTTLLRDFLQMPEAADTGVIVNEVGEIGLDGAILREGTDGEVATALLSNGCICCAMGSDLALTVDALLHAPRPGRGPLRRIVLETSGISKPGPVLRQLAALAPLHLRVRVIATYDAERGGPAAAAFAEAAAQWAGADTLVVTKADRVSPARLAAAAAEAGRINPLAQVVASAARCDAVREAFGPRPAAAQTPTPALVRLLPGSQAGPDHPSLTVLTLRSSRIVGYDALAAWLDNLAGLAGERLLRLKGLVRVAEIGGAPLLVQSVGTMFSAPQPMRQAAADGSFMVVIGRGLELDEVMSVRPDLSWEASAAAGGRPSAGTLIAEAVVA